VTLRWHILTGEYPPQPGGVSDYTRLLARALAAAGDEAQVWAPAAPGPEPDDPGVTVRRLPGRFGRRALAELDAGLARARPGFRLLVQYVPHMYGMKGMNLPFCWWLWQRRALRPWVMFHEVAFPCGWGRPLRHNLLGAAQRVMAALVARAAARIFLATRWWEPMLRGLAPLSAPVAWLPVPSNIPDSVDAAAVRLVRQAAAGANSTVVGCFGTFGAATARPLAAALPAVLNGSGDRLGLLIGRGSTAFAERLVREHASLNGRLHAAGALGPEAVAANLSACDLLLQPYPGGVCSRRGSLMAGLALGVPVATTKGAATESVWEDGAVALAPEDDPAALVAVAERLLADPVARRRLGEEGRAVYQARFSIDCTVRALRAESESEPRP
jgi:glycosyltransferase involved in cell wall biosynthesis